MSLRQYLVNAVITRACLTGKHLFKCMPLQTIAENKIETGINGDFLGVKLS